MNVGIEHDELEAALRRCGSHWNVGQAHGLLCSRLAVLGRSGGFDWLQQVLENTDGDNAACRECATMLDQLLAETHQQLSQRQSEFTPLLPGEEESAAIRAEAMAHWCEGFLHGLVSRAEGDELRARLAAEPLSDIIRDMLEITRATAAHDVADEAEDGAYTELLEYLRVAAQLVYEELAELRGPASGQSAGNADILH